MPLERNPDTAEMRKTTLISFNENEEWASQNVEIYSVGAFLYQKLEVEVAITTNSSCFAKAPERGDRHSPYYTNMRLEFIN